MGTSWVGMITGMGSKRGAGRVAASMTDRHYRSLARFRHALRVFLRFSELIAGRMAVLISHRFSTVRMADRILVLDGGRVEEIGSHEELLANGKRYAELFELQAAGYR